jgi:hypothetical protein
MKKKSKKVKEKIKFKKLTQTIFIIGLLFLLVGLYRFFLVSPLLGVNIRTNQPVITDGSFFIFVGILQIILSFYRIYFAKRS